MTTNKPAASTSVTTPANSTGPVSPVLRWAGGKRSLLCALNAVKPVVSQRAPLVEPFFGGGAFFLSQSPNSYTWGRVGDTNPHLIAFYQAVQNDLAGLEAAVGRLGTTYSKDEYLAVRAMDVAKMSASEHAAWFLYLNRTCFNGLWRVNSSGGFNVPWGKPKNPTVFDTTRLQALNARLQGVEIVLGGFTTTVEDVPRGSLVYFDPPYVPLTPTASFANYTKDGFVRADHVKLASAIRSLVDQGVAVVLSNSDTTLTREIYSAERTGLALYQISARRSISAASRSRQRVNEVIGVSYPEHQMTNSATFLASATPILTSDHVERSDESKSLVPALT